MPLMRDSCMTTRNKSTEPDAASADDEDRAGMRARNVQLPGSYCPRSCAGS